MKYFALFFLVAIAFISCNKVESQQAINSNLSTAETNSSQVETIPIVKVSLADLTKEQKQKLDERIPPKVREILDKADEINIYYNINEDTMKLRVLMVETVPNAEAKVSDPTLKKQVLESFYYDASSNSNGSGCFRPRHKITAKYRTKTVEMDICYQCSNFRGGSSSGRFGGGLAEQSKSSAIINAIIEKYGTKTK
jgi:hypothetical protein